MLIGSERAQAEILSDAGRATSQKGKYQEAAIEFTNAIKIDSGYADAHFQLAESYLHLQQGNRAYQELTRTIELRPEDYKARIDLANLLILGRKFQDAQEQVDLLLKKRPDDPGIHDRGFESAGCAGQDPRRNCGNAACDCPRSETDGNPTWALLFCR